MARIRTIKPEFWSDGVLMECSLNARLLFIGTWNFADDNGNLDRSAKQIKARIFPADDIECEPLIRELLDHGRLIEYSVNGSNYLHIHAFSKHQVINRPSKPHCPIYEDSMRAPGGIRDDSTRKGREGKGREGRGEDKAQRSRGSRLPSEWQPSELLKAWASKERPDLNVGETIAKFHDHWTSVPGSRGCKLDWEATFRNWVRSEKRGTIVATPSDAVETKRCRYCLAPATGSVNGIDHCRAHSDEAYDRKSA